MGRGLRLFLLVLVATYLIGDAYVFVRNTLLVVSIFFTRFSFLFGQLCKRHLEGAGEEKDSCVGSSAV